MIKDAVAVDNTVDPSGEKNPSIALTELIGVMIADKIWLASTTHQVK